MKTALSRERQWIKRLGTLAILCILAINPVLAGPRDAPGSALDPAARVSDFYFFKSWEDPNKLALIMNVAPGQEPGDGPMYFGFDQDVIYRIHIDNNMDGKADDVVYEIRFETENRPAFGSLTFPLPYVGNPAIVSRPELRGIVALDGPGSEGITLRQTYTVTEIRDNRRFDLLQNRKSIAVPSNVGPVTMPNYEALAAQGIYQDADIGVRVFAGQRADSFYGDLGALFDGAAPSRIPPILTPAEDANDSVNPFGLNRNQGFNVQSIVLEIPINRITLDKQNAATTRIPFIGAYASTHRRKKINRTNDGWDRHRRDVGYVQISRMGNSMINALIIDVPTKDKYNASNPEHDAQFANLFSDPPLARPPTSEIFGVPIPPPPRVDLIRMYLKYPGQQLAGTACGDPCAELLRLDLRVPPTLPKNQHRLGGLMGEDPAGIPNGRRPNDDPIDFTVRIIGGPPLIQARVSDGVNFASGTPGAGTMDGPGYGRILGNHLDVTPNGIVKEFPYLATPHDGRFYRHGH